MCVFACVCLCICVCMCVCARVLVQSYVEIRESLVEIKVSHISLVPMYHNLIDHIRINSFILWSAVGVGVAFVMSKGSFHHNGQCQYTFLMYFNSCWQIPSFRFMTCSWQVMSRCCWYSTESAHRLFIILKVPAEFVSQQVKRVAC